MWLFLKDARQLGCVFQDTEPPESLPILRKSTKVLGSIRRVRFTKATQGHANIRENKGPLLGKIQVNISHQRSPYALQFEDGSQEETERQERCARGDTWILAKNFLKLKEKDKATLFSPTNEWCLPAPSVIKPEGRCGNNIPSGLQGKHKQAMCAKKREWYSGSSSSSGGEEWKSQEHEEIKRLRARIELLSKQQGAGKSLEKLGEPARRRSGLEEGCRIQFADDTEYKKKLDEEKKSLQGQVRDIDKFANIDQVPRTSTRRYGRRSWKKSKEKRTELLPEHQKMQKKWQKMQSLRDKQKNPLKTGWRM